MSGKTGKRVTRSRSVHEKLIAIYRVRNGETKASVARSIDVPESTLRGWCKNEDRIRFLCQSSSYRMADSSEAYSHHKKINLRDTSMEPLNLSMKDNSAYSSNSDESYDAGRNPPNLHVRTPEVSTTSWHSLDAEKNLVDDRQRNAAWNYMMTNIHWRAYHNNLAAQRQMHLQYGGASTAVTSSVPPVYAGVPFVWGFQGVDQNASLLNWYRQVREANLPVPQLTHTPYNPIMYQQLERDGNGQQNAENLMVVQSTTAGFGGVDGTTEAEGKLSKEEHHEVGHRAEALNRSEK